MDDAEEVDRQLPLEIRSAEILETTEYTEPALLTMTSIRPKRATVSATARSACSRFVTFNSINARPSCLPGKAACSFSMFRLVANHLIASVQRRLTDARADAAIRAGNKANPGH